MLLLCSFCGAESRNSHMIVKHSITEYYLSTFRQNLQTSVSHPFTNHMKFHLKLSFSLLYAVITTCYPPNKRLCNVDCVFFWINKTNVSMKITETNTYYNFMELEGKKGKYSCLTIPLPFSVAWYYMLLSNCKILWFLISDESNKTNNKKS